VAEVDAARRAPPLTPEVLLASPWASLVKAMLLPAPPGGETSVLVSLHPPATGAVDEAALRAALADISGARVLQVKQSLDALYAGYMDEARALALAGAGAVLVLLAWSLRDVRRVLRVAAPLVAAVLLHVLGVALGVLHWVGLVLVVAVGSNYALFFDAPGAAPVRDPDTLASLALANLTMVLSFSLIALSHIPVLAAIGQVVAPGAGLCLLLSAAWAPRSAPGAV
jgi:predicted exporter